MHRLSVWHIFFVYQLNVGLTLDSLSNGTNFTNWSEDDWLETRFSINAKFMFNRQRYEHITLRTRMNEWSLELSYGNRSNLNKLWTELHLYLDRRQENASLNNSVRVNVTSKCRLPIISPLTNDSTFEITELTDMDKLIANYFLSDGFFRTINYIHCTINDRRMNPLLQIRIDIYLVTNREFQSLLYIEMSNATQKILVDRQAKFYMHNYESNFKYNLNLSNIDYPLNSDVSLVHMVKLYNPSISASGNSVTLFSYIYSIFFLFHIFF